MRSYTDIELLAAAHAEEKRFYRLMIALAAIVGVMFGWMVGEYEASLSVDTNVPCLQSRE